ncbi:MAG TPA: glycoside hydrolase family protein [Vicinamibacterales bacterium]
MTFADMDALKQQLKEHEGLRLKPYTDTTGHLTIGVGRNLTDVGITEDEAMEMLEHDIAIAVGALSTKLPWFLDLDDVRQRVLIDMAFNMGIDMLLTFHRFLAAARIGDWDEAANEMMASRWAMQVRDRATRLIRMMRTGETE